MNSQQEMQLREEVQLAMFLARVVRQVNSAIERGNDLLEEQTKQLHAQKELVKEQDLLLQDQLDRLQECVELQRSIREERV